MGKKNKDNKKNNIVMIVGVVVVGVIVMYFASSYSGLLGSKLYTGGSTEVKTTLECSRSKDNTLEAKLTVSGVTNNPAALDVASALQAETITWIASESSGTINPSVSITDEQGIARTKLTPVAGAEAPLITALFAGDTIQIDTRENMDDTEPTTYIVEYAKSTCDIPNVNQ